MNRSGWILSGIMALGLGLRIYGINWGLPEVFEEAYPFKKSWEMWGWGSRPFDPNPHFFNYPSMYFYIQFVGQGLLLMLLRLTGVVHSVLDYQTLYALDKTPFYVAARSIGVVFAMGTIAVTYFMGRRVGNLRVATIASLLVAVNSYHILKSQYVEVDIPLTFFVMMTALFSLRLLETPSRSNYVWAGFFAGLACSTKYSGGVLPVSILTAHLIAMHRFSGTPDVGLPAIRRSRLWANLGLAGLVCLGALLVTSPYILLDYEAFWTGFSYERLHMSLGHFGLDEAPALVFYGKVVVDQLLGWPIALTTLFGVVYLTFVRRQLWVLVLLAYPLVYVSIISSWSMKAERYILPIVPIACLITSVALVTWTDRLREHKPRLALLSLMLFIGVLVQPSWTFYQSNLRRLRGDTRSVARRWIEENIEPGALIITEAYGPDPVNAIAIANLSKNVKQQLTTSRPDTKIYGLLQIPMIQVRAEFMTVFYDISHFDEWADYIIVSSFIQLRYRRDPEKFAEMLAFYEQLNSTWTRVAEFDPERFAGPKLTIYRNPRLQKPFASRTNMQSPLALDPITESLPGTVGPHYQRLAAIFEYFGFHVIAAETYAMGLSYGQPHPTFHRDVTIAAIRCYAIAKRPDEAFSVVELAISRATNEADREYWRRTSAKLFEVVPASP